MALTLASAARLLSEHGLLREIIQGDAWTLDAQTINGFDKPFGSITYDTRQVVSGALLCCKGRFKAEYLDGIDDRELAAYVAENDFSAATKAPGLIVNDARKAMSLLSAAFYGYPQNQLKVIGITGTKGKPLPPTSPRPCSTAVPTANALCSLPWIIALTDIPMSSPI